MDCISMRQLHFINYVRLLWEQHSNWSGMALTSIIFKLPNEEEVVERLLRNPEDFDHLLCNFYGEDKAREFAELLTEHLILAADLMKALMADDKKKAKGIQKKWYRNGDEIVTYLSEINPYWSREEWKEMFFEHLELIGEIGLSLINKEYELAVMAQDQLEYGALEMANLMIAGIMEQFPWEFKNLGYD